MRVYFVYVIDTEHYTPKFIHSHLYPKHPLPLDYQALISHDRHIFCLFVRGMHVLTN